MKAPAWHLAAVAIMVTPTTHCVSIPPRESDGLRVVALQIERQAPRDPIHRDKRRMKRDPFSVGLDNAETLYFINATVGTPPEAVRLHIDTGSSDLWVNTPSSTYCTSARNPCAAAGTYTPNASTTYQYVNSKFNITYVDGSSASGDYVSDTLTFGSQAVPRLQLGVGYASTNPQGILGIGYPSNEVQVTRHGLPPYRNLPEQLVADGVIRSSAYSMWLNDLSATTGSILFGGVDAARYEPPLRSVPVETATGSYREFMVTLTKLQLGGLTLGRGEDLAIAVLLDSGSTLTYLPDRLAGELFDAVNATYDADANAAYVPCTLAQGADNLTFTFSEPAIPVGLGELVLDVTLASGRQPAYADGTPACLFGVAAAAGGTYVLGDTFLRSAYVVFDLENHEISLAPTRFLAAASGAAVAAAASSVKEIGVGMGSVPGASRVQNAVRPTEGLRGGKSSGGIPSGPMSAASGTGVMWKAAAAAAAAVGVTAVMGSWV
ncbi:hypothetical protein VTJ83DRAFT_2557 [Remersonia thermophila]|uniref:Peptidase A1 domain-containing protein n=1 Tax=Remersonia thermophila TaxID=72144 RepID=A0ABR4DJ37_9PEZI